MPFLHLSTPTGALDVYYNISTPTSHSSLTIAAELPCILFLHAGFIGQEIFEGQFSDPQLRKHFNLIAMDMRGWGQTQGPVGTNSYSPADSAADVCRFLKALDLPPLHIFGLSIGGYVALEVAASHPHLILSCTWCSPLPSREPTDIAAGRHEVWECWAKAFDHSGKSFPAPILDIDLLQDVKRGAEQLCFNNQLSCLTEAVSSCAVAQAVQFRAGTPEKLADSYATGVTWFTNRRPLSRVALSKITCPIRLIHCADDVAYPLCYAERVEVHLRDAGIEDIVLHQVPGAHYGNLTSPQAVNPILYDVVSSVSRNGEDLSPPSSYKQQNDYPKFSTPFTKQLAEQGYDPEDRDSDSDG